ncbi:hypothetical protein ORN01_19535 [Bacillus cereus]|uniref:hypothetical protein n=1 Tax=Bacillus TaxID=1386 RepID=UPI001427D248|nr:MULTISPECIES: hypothetical protein [Bacillus cereus group]WIL44679.1 hypothetical protein QP042_01735 [Bacillus bombysepticus]MDA1974803.1 hypothetical protein [Bacillus cereus]MDA2440753.1 hypothetical protein [Bacillus cereus]MDA2446749.1 hypothetical protein [Bacillus cereus]MDA2661572.1 hypothetical protein [Bacillus cereus]
MKKTLVISAITLALTSVGASSSFASTENVSITPEKISQNKAVKVASKSKKKETGLLVSKEFDLKDGEATTPTLDHKKGAEMRISIQNNSTGDVRWFLKNSKDKVVSEGYIKKGQTGKESVYREKGKYKIRVISESKGTGKVHIGARTIE